MTTHTDFKRMVTDFAKLGGDASIALGTTGFAGDGDRLYMNFNDTGVLFSHKDAKAFLLAASQVAARLGYQEFFTSAPDNLH